jgi:hypothetical protein
VYIDDDVCKVIGDSEKVDGGKTRQFGNLSQWSVALPCSSMSEGSHRSRIQYSIFKLEASWNLGESGRRHAFGCKCHIHLRKHATLEMHPFASYVLRSYYRATGWNEDNLYANLTRSSNGAPIVNCVPALG